MARHALWVAALALATAAWCEQGGASPAERVYKNGLVAHYFQDPVEWDGSWIDGTNPTVEAKDYTFRQYGYSRVEPLINHLFVKRGWFSVRWVGYVVVPGKLSELDANISSDKDKSVTGKIKVDFEFWADDGARMWIDGNQVINDWRPMWEKLNEAHRCATVELAPGPHRLVVEYFEGQALHDGDSDPAKLSWTIKDLDVKPQIIPASRYKYTDADLMDYVPSQGLSASDKLATKDGTAAPNLLPGKGDPEALGQQHLALADAAEVAGNFDTAIAEYGWVIQNCKGTRAAEIAHRRLLALQLRLLNKNKIQ